MQVMNCDRTILRQRPILLFEGLKEMKVDNVEGLRNLMRYGMAVRTTGATLMNEHSSRSHAILTLYLDKKSSKSARNMEVIETKFMSNV